MTGIRSNASHEQRNTHLYCARGRKAKQGREEGREELSERKATERARWSGREKTAIDEERERGRGVEGERGRGGKGERVRGVEGGGERERAQP